MAVTQYIGSRYVPLFADPVEWSSAKQYEPLTIVIHEGNSYTSKQFVPVGVDIANEAFWALTGNYNAQVELYRREAAEAKQTADDAQTSADNAQTSADNAQISADNAQSAADAAQTSADNAQTDIDTLLPKNFFSAEHTVKSYVDNVSDIINQMLVNEEPNIKTIFSGFYKDGHTYVDIFKMPKNKTRLSPTLAIGNNLPNLIGPYDYTDSANYAMTQQNVFLVNFGLQAPTISNNVVKAQQASADGEYWNVLVMSQNGELSFIQDKAHTITANTLLSQGYIMATGFFQCLVIDGSEYDNSAFSDLSTYDTVMRNSGPRSCLGWDDDYWYVLLCDGRQPYNKGLTHSDMVTLALRYGIDNLVCGDGGGSVQAYIPNNGSPITTVADTNPTHPYYDANSRRSVPSLLRFEFV